MIQPKTFSHAIGQHFIVGIDGPVLLPTEARMLKELAPLGIILFAKNIASDSSDWIEHLTSLITDCKAASGREDLIVSIDHEGGRVHRLPPPVTHFPYAREYAKHSREVAYVMGSELRALGFNLSFSPVLDIDLEPENSVIALRSFGTEPDAVALAAVEYMLGLHDAGVLSCGKHFPGHGGTIADSHFELPTRDISIEELRGSEIKPYERYLQCSPPMLMSAHVLYPQIDPDNPATLSPKILTSILRGELGFNGVLISDDLEMLALSHLKPGQRAQRCIEAGVDLLLEGNSNESLPLELATTMAIELCERIDGGEIGKELLHSSSERISNLLKDLVRLQNESQRKTFPLDLIGCLEHAELKQGILV
jgi:beta-N-acetylhexosaminidase